MSPIISGSGISRDEVKEGYRICLRSTILFIAIIILSLMAAGSTSGAIHFLEADGSGDFPNIKTAIQNSNTGDTIWLNTGTYAEYFTVDKSLKFKGPSGSQPTIEGVGTGTLITLLTDDVLFDNITISNARTGIYGNNVQNITLYSVTITDMQFGVKWTSGSQDSLIQDCEFTSNDYGIVLLYDHDIIIKDNQFDGNIVHGLYSGNSMVNIDAKNNWWGDITGPSGDGPGSGDSMAIPGSDVDYSLWLLQDPDVGSSEGYTITVDRLGGGDFVWVQDAIDAAWPSSTISVGPGNYFDVITIDKPLTIIGTNRETAILDASGNGVLVDILSDDVHIENLTLNDASTVLMINGRTNITLDKLNVWNSTVGVRISQGSDDINLNHLDVANNEYGVVAIRSNTIDIHNCSFSGNNTAGLYVANAIGITDATDNWWSHDNGPRDAGSSTPVLCVRRDRPHRHPDWGRATTLPNAASSDHNHATLPEQAHHRRNETTQKSPLGWSRTKQAG